MLKWPPNEKLTWTKRQVSCLISIWNTWNGGLVIVYSNHPFQHKQSALLRKSDIMFSVRQFHSIGIGASQLLKATLLATLHSSLKTHGNKLNKSSTVEAVPLLLTLSFNISTKQFENYDSWTFFFKQNFVWPCTKKSWTISVKKGISGAALKCVCKVCFAVKGLSIKPLLSQDIHSALRSPKRVWLELVDIYPKPLPQDTDIAMLV